MIVVMKPGASEAELALLVEHIRASGLREHVSRGTERVLVGAIGDERVLDTALIGRLPGVERALRIVKPYRLVSRELVGMNSVVQVGTVPIGGEAWQLIVGPTSVATPGAAEAVAASLAPCGARLMHGGVYGPALSGGPYEAQGAGVAGLEHLLAAARARALPAVAELTDVRLLETFLEYGVDALLIGARNMQNFELLKEVGRVNKPVILKRALAATAAEWLMAAEYVAVGGNHRIVLCERGVRGFDDATPALFDAGAIAWLKRESHLPVIADPGRAVGRADLVAPVAMAALAAGADGLMVDVGAEAHALDTASLQQLGAQMRALAPALGRTFA